jgi:hypothetical protein
MVTTACIALAAAGLLLSLAAHLTAVFGVDPNQYVPGVWLLHLGVFLALGPVIWRARSKPGPKHLEYQARVEGGSPFWLKPLTAIFFAYALFNFFHSGRLNEGGVPSVINGEHVLHNHGRIIRKLTPEEFSLHQAHTVRGFSGHWMLFYCVALSMLIGIRRADAIASDETMPAS